MSITHSSRCFSGNCGLCIDCCGSVANHVQSSNQSTRAKDLYKFSKGTLDKDYDVYWRNMHKLKIHTYFTTPENESLLAREYGIERFYNDEVYAKTPWKLLTENKGKRCQMPQCQMFHEHTHEFNRNALFQNIPLYQSEHATICALCVRENGSKNIRSL